MQVADNTQLVSSATLGGAQEVIDFGISDDPAFFQILSSNLYSNQKLAVVREVLCNSWDAHIDAGITDQAVEITYKDGVLNFRDFGKGIAHEDMGRVYGTYGSSTKKNDSKSTGGFGLGCKAPFAYTDSFRVTSCHMGVKTLYNISKSSVESKGKPSIVKILSMPTNETGLTVSIAIDRSDWQEFGNYLKSITLLGEIKATLTTDTIATTEYQRLDMPFIPGAYLAETNNWYDSYMGNHRVFIRYGNVVYPVLNTPATRPAVETIERFLDILSLHRVLVQAAPDSLALTPGRESLSSQKKTENGIVDVVTDLVARMETDVKKRIPQVMAEYINNLSKHGRNANILHEPDWFLYIRGIEGHYLRSPFGVTYREHYRVQLAKAEVDYLTEAKDFMGSKLESVFRNAVFRAKKKDSMLPYQQMHRKYFLKPIMRVFSNNVGVLDLKSLRIQTGSSYRSILTKGFYEPKYMCMDSVSLWHQGINLIFASTSLRDITDSIRAYPEFNPKGHEKPGKYNSNAKYGDLAIYRLSTNAVKRQNELKALAASGFTVVDLTQNYEWDPRYKLKVIKEKEPKVKSNINGLHSLRSLLGEYEEYIGKGRLTRKVQRNGFIIPEYGQTLPYDQEPEFYVELPDVHKLQLGRFYEYHGKHDPILDKGVFVTNGTERRMAIKRGAVHVDTYFFKPIMEKYLSKEMLTYLSKQRLSGLNNYYLSDGLVELCRSLGCLPKAVDKLIHDPDLELCIDTIGRVSLANLLSNDRITKSEYDAIIERETISLKEFTWIGKLKAVSTDYIMQDYDYEDLCEYLEKHPERKAAFRSLILIAMKNGK